MCAVFACVHTYVHAVQPAYLPTYLPTYVPTYVPTYMRTLTYTHTHRHAYIHKYIHAYVYIRMYVRRTYVPTYVHLGTSCLETGAGSHEAERGSASPAGGRRSESAELELHKVPRGATCSKPAEAQSRHCPEGEGMSTIGQYGHQ